MKFVPSERFAPGKVSDSMLAIATGFDLSLALTINNVVVAEQQLPLVKGHAEALVPEIAALMAPLGGPSLQPSRIVVEIGPGSFTGLRIGIAAARALGLAWQARVEGVGSALLIAAEARAHMIAHGTAPDVTALVALAAPRGQIWVEPVALRDLRSEASSQALSETEAINLARTYPIVVGSAASRLTDHDSAGWAHTPRARLAKDIPTALMTAPLPLYIRAPETD
ncbi:MAG: tRNA (adenosine(37)-N6)-threonylcarbamoyltransferase complex dimerization subunit type 1 TsaB [Sphingomonadaceae bacterium]